MLSLVLGNLHVPYRAIDLPFKFKELLEKNQGKIDKIYICSTAEDPIMAMNTTNSDLLQFLHNQVCSDIELVGSSVTNPEELGNKYEQPLSTKTRKDKNGLSVYNINGFRVAFVSQIPVVPKDDVLALINLSRQTRSDILIWAGKHEVEAYSLEGVLFLSPGTATGAFSIESYSQVEEALDENTGEIIEETEEDEEKGDDNKENITNEEDGEGKLQVESMKETEDNDTKDDKKKDDSVDSNNTEDQKKVDDSMVNEDVNANGSQSNIKEKAFEIHKSLNVEPSFILLDIPQSKIEGEDVSCTVYIYSLDTDSQDINIDDIQFKKS
ncbi:hypothetical protein FOG51_00647 [Hanseniaspora uvarum]|nr:hypothetical protein FOG51_00647 [Hanseniaspora uvarum]